MYFFSLSSEYALISDIRYMEFSYLSQFYSYVLVLLNEPVQFFK